MCKSATFKVNNQKNATEYDDIVILQNKLLELIGDPILERVAPELDETLYQVIKDLTKEKRIEKEEDRDIFYPRRVCL